MFCSAIAVEEVKLRPGLARRRDAPLVAEPAGARVGYLLAFAYLGYHAHNNGRYVEILADRGIDALVSTSEWHNIRDMMEAEFRRGNFEAGVIEGIEAV